MTVQAQVPAQQQKPNRKRGRESVTDMIRSLGLVLVIVIVAWFLAQPPDSDEQAIRVIDTAPTLTQLQRDNPAVPVPGNLPALWRPTSANPTGDGLRIGYVTPTDEYAEYVVSLASGPDFLPEVTGRAILVGDFQVGDVTWQQYQDGDRSTSLVRVVNGRTVVVGGFRETTTLEELRTLAATIKP